MGAALSPFEGGQEGFLKTSLKVSKLKQRPGRSHPDIQSREGCSRRGNRCSKRLSQEAHWELKVVPFSGGGMTVLWKMMGKEIREADMC